MSKERKINLLTDNLKSGKKTLLVCGILSAAVLMAMCMFTIRMGVNGVDSLFLNSLRPLTSEWIDDEGNAISLPGKISWPQDGIYILRTILPSTHTEVEGLSLLFTAKYLNVRLFLDGEEIGSCLCKPPGMKKTIGKTFLFVPLPKNLSGRELRIEAVPLLSMDMEYEINAPVIGTSGRLVCDLIRSDLPMLISVEGIFCFGLLLILFSWQARNVRNGTFFQIGMFAILFSLYSLAITDTVHLFLGNSTLIYIMEFLLLALFPIPLVVLVYNVCLAQFQPLILANICVLVLNFCIQAALYFFIQLELRDTVQLTHVLLFFSIVLLIPVLMLSGRQGEDRHRLLISFLPILVGSLWDLARFYLPGTYQKAVGFQLGVLLFVFLQTRFLVRSYLESDLYRSIAYTDALTGLPNRAAFEEKIIELRKDSSCYKSIWCVCADINNLKHVNDTLGHHSGDELICQAAKVLHSVKSKESVVFRTGGDEFVLFAFNQSAESMKEGRSRFDEALHRYNQKCGVPLSIALGYACFNKDAKDTITMLISRTDSIMYEDKRKQKEKMENHEFR